MRHVFKVINMGWEHKQEGFWFDTKYFTKEEALALFKPFKGISQKGFPYTGYEYNGQKFYKILYLGEFANNKMPKCDFDLLTAITKKAKK